MKIDNDHMFHGAALMQIAEDPHFTAINALRIPGLELDNVFRINDNIGIHLKYCGTKSKGKFKEYQFTFNRLHLRQLAAIAKVSERTYLALVCVRAKQICCLSYNELIQLVERRRSAHGAREAQYVVPVTLPPGGRFRVYINPPTSRGRRLGDEFIIPRNAFPGRLFG